MSTEGMPEFTLADLPTADLGNDLRTVQRDHPAARAFTIMIADEFSQLPIMSGRRDVVGVVTWRSLACHKVGANTTAGDVREPIPGGATLPLTTPVVDVLDLVFSSDFVLTHKGNNELCGIVTASDMTLWAKHCSKAFLAVAEIERHLRGALRKVDPALLNSAASIGTTSADRVDGAYDPDSWTFAHYRSFFNRGDEAWGELPQEQLWSRIDRGEFRRRLQAANEARNKAFHFRSGGCAPTPEEKDVKGVEDAELLTKFAKCLRVITGDRGQGQRPTGDPPTDRRVS